jgi:hypothetical protein
VCRVIKISIVFIFYAFVIGWGTVINIPADYPAIQQGIDASVNGDTVLVQPGTYVENINFNGHNIVLGSLFMITGDTTYIYSTIIDGDETGRVIQIANGENNNAVVSGFTIQNAFSGNGGGIYCSGSSPQILNNIITNNVSHGFGGGAYCDNNSAAFFRNNVFSGNRTAWGGGGLYIENSEVILMQNVILGNVSISYGGGVLCYYNADVYLLNNTFSANVAYFGGALCYLEYSNLIISNSIFWDDSCWVQYAEICGDTSSVATYTYCDIQNTSVPGEGNIDIDPLFSDPENDDFHLMSMACGDSADSPCIDTGDPNILDSLLDCSWGLGGPRCDMGAFGGGDSTTVDIYNNNSSLPNEFMLLQNYPNPFNSGTTIRYFVVKPDRVTLTVYDLLGREIRTLVDEYMQAGFHMSTFDAAGLSSGVYFCRLRVGEAIQSKPMVLMK